MDRVVIVGSGSAGYRHARFLRQRDPELHIVMVRRPLSRQPLERLLPLGLELVDSVEEAATTKPTIAVVAGPASTHRHDVETLASRDTTLLVEKPLSTTSADARLLVAAAEKANSPLIVGYHLRFSSTVSSLRALIADGTIGAPISFDFKVGQHLSDWRHGIDPYYSVTARRELGGGVLLELSHELDGVRFLLDEIAFCSARLLFDGAPTDGLVETVADLDLQLVSGIWGRVHLDMVSRLPARIWTVVGTDGTLTADLLTGTITRSAGSQVEEVHSSGASERDQAEVALISNLFDVAEGRTSPRCTGHDGIAAVEIVEAARISHLIRSTDPRSDCTVAVGSFNLAGTTVRRAKTARS